MDESKSLGVAKLRSGNYNTWATQAYGVFLKEGCAQSFYTPPFTTADWERDQKAIGILILLVDRDYHHLLQNAQPQIFRAMWHALQVHFAAPNPRLASELERALTNLRLGEGETISAFYARVDQLRTQLMGAGVFVSDSQIVSRMSSALPRRFDMRVVPLLDTPAWQTMTPVDFSKLLMDEEHRLQLRAAQDDNSYGSSASAMPAVSSPAATGVPGGRGNRQGNWAEQPRGNSSGYDRNYGRGYGHSDSRGGRGGGRGRGRGHSRGGGGGRGGGRGSNRPTCYICDSPDHFYKQCPRRQPDHGSAAFFTAEVPAAGLATLSGFSGWIEDSGATNHMTGDASLLSSYRELTIPRSVVTATGGLVEAVGEGSMHFKLPTGKLTLLKVLYVPSLKCNLLSVPRALDAGAQVLFKQDQAVITIRALLYYGHRQGDVFVLTECKATKEKVLARRAAIAARVKATLAASAAQESSSAEHATASASAQAAESSKAAAPAKPSSAARPAFVDGQRVPDAQLMHYRLGHTGHRTLANMARHHAVLDLNVPAADFVSCQHKVCESCALGKLTRSSHPSTNTRRQPAEVLHSDLCGPLPTSLGGATFLITLVDDATGFTLVGALKHKSDAQAWLRWKIAELERVTGRTVKALRSDRGGEYVSEELSRYLRDKGITQQFSAPYTPQQNGVAERTNRTLLERVRTLLVDSRLGPGLWAEAVSTVAFLKNLTATEGSKVTPQEAFSGVKPSVKRLRVFGSVAYVRVPNPANKLMAVARKGVMVGYEPGAYRVYIPADRTVVVSPDVIFDEASRISTPPPSISQDLLDTFYTPRRPSAPAEDAGGNNQATEADGTAVPAPGTTPPQPAPLRRSTREKRPNVRYQDYAAAASASESSSASASAWQPQTLRAYATAATASGGENTGEGIVEPKSIEEALNGPQARLWRESIQRELQAHTENGTWQLRSTPSGVTPVPCKWVFKIKRDKNGQITDMKSRLVAKGYAQRYGVDFDEVYSPVCRSASVRSLLAVACAKDWDIMQMDVTAAFLNGELEETVYMQQPPGFEVGGARVSCHLKKAIYGLKQAPRAWYNKLRGQLEQMGFRVSSADPGLFVMQHGNVSTFLVIHVDDMLVTGPDAAEIQRVKKLLCGTFKVKEISGGYYLGLEITRNRQARTLHLSQTRYTRELLKRFDMSSAKAAAVPLGAGVKLTQHPQPGGVHVDAYHSRYMELVGCLLYLSTHTRPDISYSVGLLARYMSNPTSDHLAQAKTVLRYLGGTAEYGLRFSGSNGGSGGSGSSLSLRGFSDANYASDLDTRRSSTGFVYTLNGGAVSWSSKLQPTVALSTSEAEYMAAAAAVREGLWLKQLLAELSVGINTVPIAMDSQGAMKILLHPGASNRSKHIDVMHHFARERAEKGEVSVHYIPTECMPADALTKGLDCRKFQFCRSAMGIMGAI